jgi:hypothetical protein
MRVIAGTASGDVWVIVRDIVWTALGDARDIVCTASGDARDIRRSAYVVVRANPQTASVDVRANPQTASVNVRGESFEELAMHEREPTGQDFLLWSLCRPERLIELARQFILYDEGGAVKKIARYQQYFAIRSTLERVRQYDPQGARSTDWFLPISANNSAIA